MSKYDSLREHLLLSGRDRVTLQFAELEAIVGELPRSAWEYQAWWANEQNGPHVQAHAWSAAGYRVESVDQVRGVVTFVRAKGGS